LKPSSIIGLSKLSNVRLKRIPVVLAASGHDPSGGAGIQADIEVIKSFGCHVCTLITSLTVQDTVNVYQVIPQDPTSFQNQARTLLRDIKVDILKVGLLGSAEIVHALKEIVDEFNIQQLVLDPILRAGGGNPLADESLLVAMREELLPHTTILTPNIYEASKIAGTTDLAMAAETLQNFGCRNVLVTGADSEGEEVINRWFGPEGMSKQWVWPKLPGSFHGSGCTLAAAISANLALGRELEVALAKAQEFTFRALQKAHYPGSGQWVPQRVSVD
jgi:hydroxymethylpyrimidine/phosphomethylpyrimidine kinase